MKKKIAVVILSVVTIILEILPLGAVCIFSGDGGAEYVRTYSYFDLTPYAYANFTPFITALLTCLILILSAVSCFRKSRRLNIAVTVISALAAVISAAPLLIGSRYYTLLGGAITAVLAVIFVLSFQRKTELK